MSEKKIIIVGAGGSGKNHLAQRFEKKGFINAVLHTSRPIRAKEKEGKDYFYVTEERFQFLKKEGTFLADFTTENGWHYGISHFEFAKSDLILLPPILIEQLKERNGLKNCFIIYLKINEEILRERLESRNDADSAARRLDSDRRDFHNFCEFDLLIDNPWF